MPRDLELENWVGGLLELPQVFVFLVHVCLSTLHLSFMDFMYCFLIALGESSLLSALITISLFLLVDLTPIPEYLLGYFYLNTAHEFSKVSFSWASMPMYIFLLILRIFFTLQKSNEKYIKSTNHSCYVKHPRLVGAKASGHCVQFAPLLLLDQRLMANTLLSSRWPAFPSGGWRTLCLWVLCLWLLFFSSWWNKSNWKTYQWKIFCG